VPPNLAMEVPADRPRAEGPPHPRYARDDLPGPPARRGPHLHRCASCCHPGPACSEASGTLHTRLRTVRKAHPGRRPRAETCQRPAGRGEYLRAYGPARVEDFAWWAGVAKGAAAKALQPHDAVDLGGGLLLRARDEAAFGRVRPLRGTVDLLPKWDAYTMAYAPEGRQRFVHPNVQHLVYTPIGVGLPGDGNPVVLVDGQAVATWTFTLKGGPTVRPFDTLGPRIRRKVNEETRGRRALAGPTGG